MVSQYRVGSIIGSEGRFEVFKMLGKGSFGAVYLCKDLIAAKDPTNTEPLNVALKVEMKGKTLKNEVDCYRLLRGTGFEAVPTCYGANVLSRPHFITMSIEGLSWSDIQSKSKDEIVSMKRLLSLGFHSIAAFESIHKVGVLHCDVRSANLCLSASPGKNTILLLDFGLSIKVKLESDRRIYSSRATRRTGFSSPRVAEGNRPQELDDLYSLCLIFLTMRNAWEFYDAPLEEQIIQKKALFADPAAFLEPEEFFLVPIVRAVSTQSYDGLPNYGTITNSFHSIVGFDQDYCIKNPM